MPIPPPSYPAPPAPNAPDASGAPARPPGVPAPRLWRSRSDRVVAGVLGGLAEKFGLEPLPLRILYGLLTAASGGLLVIPYLGLWYITATLGPPRPPRPLRRSREKKLVAGVLGGLAEKLGVPPTLLRGLFVALSAVTFGVPGLLIYLILWMIVPPADTSSE